MTAFGLVWMCLLRGMKDGFAPSAPEFRLSRTGLSGMTANRNLAAEEIELYL